MNELTGGRAGQVEKVHNKVYTHVEAEEEGNRLKGPNFMECGGRVHAWRRERRQTLILAASTFISGQTYTTGPLSGLVT